MTSWYVPKEYLLLEAMFFLQGGTGQEEQTRRTDIVDICSKPGYLAVMIMMCRSYFHRI